MIINSNNLLFWYPLDLPIMRRIAIGIPLLWAAFGVYCNRRIPALSDRLGNLLLLSWISLAITIPALVAWSIFLDDPIYQTYMTTRIPGGPPDIFQKANVAHNQMLLEANLTPVASHIILFGLAIVIALFQGPRAVSETKPEEPAKQP